MMSNHLVDIFPSCSSPACPVNALQVTVLDEGLNRYAMTLQSDSFVACCLLTVFIGCPGHQHDHDEATLA